MASPPEEDPSRFEEGPADRRPESAEADVESTDQTVRFQFTIRRLLLLTTVCAVIGAALTCIGTEPAMPDRARFTLRLVVGLYLMSLAAYAVLRLPHACRGLLRKTRAWDRLRSQRAELMEMVVRRRQEAARSKPAASREAAGSPDQGTNGTYYPPD